jgi:AraC-like DNA-binding protein
MTDDAEDRSPLERYRVVRTADRTEASRCLENALGPHELVVTGHGRPDIRLHSCQLKSVSLSYLSFGTDVCVRLDAARTRYLVHVPLAGRARLDAVKECLLIEPKAGVVVPPDDPVSLWCTADCVQLVVSLDRGHLHAHTRSLLNSQPAGPPHFEMAMDTGSGRVRDWYTVLRSYVDLADTTDGILQNPLMVAEVERALMTGLLLAQPNTYSQVLHEQITGNPPTPADAAILLINTHPQRNHTVTDLARAAGVSVRTLEKAFRRRLGVTPHAYLRDVRLERVRSELTEPATERKRVSEVAARWGLHHFGRFARDYYRKYQEKPSETTRRSRSAGDT